MVRGIRITALLALVFAAVILFSPVISHAAGLPDKIVPTKCTGDNAATKCGICDVAQLGQNILNTGIYIAVFFSAIMFAWAGWKAVTSGGDSHAYGEAKGIFVNVLIGLIIILAAWLIIDTLMKTLTGDKFGPWNKICNVAMVSYFDHFYA